MMVVEREICDRAIALTRRAIGRDLTPDEAVMIEKTVMAAMAVDHKIADRALALARHALGRDLTPDETVMIEKAVADHAGAHTTLQ